MRNKCQVFEQVRLYVNSLRRGFPRSAEGFLGNVRSLIKDIEFEECGRCVKGNFPNPTGCKTFYLQCGSTLLLGDVNETFVLIDKPENGTISTEDGLKYEPFEGYVGDDSFVYFMDGVTHRVCTESSPFEAELRIIQATPFLNNVSIVTDCDDPHIVWTIDGNELEQESITVTPKTIFSVRVECGGCVHVFAPCIVCDAKSAVSIINETVKEIHTFDRIASTPNTIYSNLESEVQSIHVDETEDCGEPATTSEWYLETKMWYKTVDTQPIIERFLVDIPPTPDNQGADEGAVGVSFWWGGECYPISQYTVLVPAIYPVIDIMHVGSERLSAMDFIDADMSTANFDDIANIVEDVLEGEGYFANMNIVPQSVAGQTVFYRINLETNAPLGRLRFENPSASLDDPSGRILAGFTK